MKLPIFTRNFVQLFKEKTFGLLLLLLLFILLTASILVSVVIVIFNPQYLVQEDLKVGYIDDDLPEPLFSSRDLAFIKFANESEMMTYFDNGSLNAAILVQERIALSSAEAQPLLLDIRVGEDPLTQSLVLSLLKPSLQRVESMYQEERDALRPAIWETQVMFSRRMLNGMSELYEAMLGFMIPLILLLPIFLIGNLFVDSISQEIEEGNLALLFTAVSPLRYIHEHLLQAFVLNGGMLLAFLGLLWVRFSFLDNLFSVFVYNSLFLFVIILFAILFVFLFKQKELAQLSYTFVVITIFMLSPFLPFGPTFMITDMLLGNVAFSWIGFGVVFGIGAILYGILYWYMKKEYYL